MSDGIKAVYEDMEKESWDKDMARMGRVPSARILALSQEAERCIDGLIRGSLSLTRGQHDTLDRVLKNLRRIQGYNE